VGCGSTADDRLVFRFVGFDSSGITQKDSVRATSADVDVVQDACDSTMPEVVNEPFTVTSINATFRNEEGSDIQLDGYTVHFDDPRTGLADFSGSLNGNIVGGRCSNNAQCTVDADCVAAGGTGATTSVTCDHTQTTISGIVLFDFKAKAHVSPQIFGEATSLTITFFGSDANQSFQTTAGYVVTFDDFDNCSTTTGGGAGGS
jgi:hypothetical protein